MACVLLLSCLFSFWQRVRLRGISMLSDGMGHLFGRERWIWDNDTMFLMISLQ